MINLCLMNDMRKRAIDRDEFPTDDLGVGLSNHPRALSQMMLGNIPRLQLVDKQKEQSSSIFESAPSGIVAEQFRMMQRRLVNMRPCGGSVLFTSPGAADGKSLNAHNLAYALAEAGHNTLLLELDLRRPSQMKYIASQPHKSLVDVLSGDVAPENALSRLSDAPLFYLGLSKPAARPAKLLRSQSLDELLSWARNSFVWTIIDGPPVLAVADVEELLPKVDLVLMVARERATPRVMLERAVAHLGDRINLVIYNDVVLSNEYGYGY